MKAEKNQKTGKWDIQYRYTDWQGKRRKSMKRGFATKREAEEWVRNFLMQQAVDFDMKFKDFIDLYFEDMKNRLRENTIRSKRYIVDLKIVPYFGERSMNTITAADIRKWQNELMQKGYAQTYLKTINNQLSCIFNYAVKYYDLKSNPCSKAGSMGRSRADEMNFWTKEEFLKFSDAVMNKRTSYLAFTILFWTGMRLGELLALQIKDVDLERRTISISKSYQRISGRDVITEPKTPKSFRTINIPEFLAVDIRDYIDSLYKPEPADRLLPITKYFLEHEMLRGITESGVKRIRIHDLRHSHASMLIELGFSPVEIANRLGHQKVSTLLEIYSHEYPDKQDKLAARLNKEYEEVLS